MTLSCRTGAVLKVTNHCIQLLSVLVAILTMPIMHLFQVDSYHILVSCFYMVYFCKYEVRPNHQPKNDIKLVLWIIMIIDELLVFGLVYSF
jgi:1,4-dihydroxy-2-naphthoate octaprenyltransferase